MKLSAIANDFAANANDIEVNPQVWSNLKEAITTSSGFDKWQSTRHEQPASTKTENVIQDGVDDLVRTYLRETLETLAY
ncbi:MAG: hypothetical protein NW214_15505 [Pseudanabaenaceae cyanobacterium bins.39]|nr:hypothetical protein [Pseudanabaenaceae cyanobacterium bins.39]